MHFSFLLIGIGEKEVDVIETRQILFLSHQLLTYTKFTFPVFVIFV